MWRCRSTKGQVSIFLVLVFQVLFVLFAMIINVGMLVYYKINLQNAVDLSAYYAGMKQAEMLNTIGHINYQMHQNWKLFSFRTMILGTLGPDNHVARPVNLQNRIVPPAPAVDGPYKIGDEYGGPTVCITVAEIYRNALTPNSNEANADDNQCKSEQSRNLRNFSIPAVVYNLSSFNQVVRGGAIAMQDQYVSQLAQAGIRNFMTATAYISLFRADSLNRKKVISVLANGLSKDESDFDDLENVSVKSTATYMLKRNLADQNSAHLDNIELYNSLANRNCGGPNPEIESLPNWLQEINILSMPTYLDSGYGGPDASASVATNRLVRKIGGEITNRFDPNNPIPFPGYDLDSARLNLLIDYHGYLGFKGILNNPRNRWTPTVGVEKNPWCLPYVGLKAETSPRLPFLPSGFSPKLVAKSFTKPFGASIGPWYNQTWQKRSPHSDNLINGKIDLALGYRIIDNEPIPQPTGNRDLVYFSPLTSRFPGDDWGFFSTWTRWAYGRYFWHIQRGNTPFDINMWVQNFDDGFRNNAAENSPFYRGPTTGDILAEAFNPDFFPPTSDRNRLMGFAKEMRRAELAAIAPDLFDVTYYSIEPRFNQVLLPRLQSYVARHNPNHADLMVRGDFGWRKPGSPPGERNIDDINANVETQIKIFRDHEFLTQTGHQVFQSLTDPQHLLMSWAEKAIVDYEPSRAQNKIATCFNPNPDTPDRPWTSGSCIQGGRTGYSIKLVSKRFLTREIPDIGGRGVNGTILNPPPDSF